MRHHRKLTDDELRQIIAARADGMPVKGLARQYGVSRRTIYNTLNKAQRPLPFTYNDQSDTPISRKHANPGPPDRNRHRHEPEETGGSGPAVFVLDHRNRAAS
jgi:transposase-like protein